MPEDNAKRAARAFASAAFLACAAAGGTNLVINPHGNYPWHVLRPMTWSSREQKVTAMRSVKPPVMLILGSSRTMIFPPSVVASTTGITASYNASVDSAKAEDMYAMWRYARDLGWKPSALVVGVDHEAFYDPAPTDTRTLASPELRGYLPLPQKLEAAQTIGATIFAYGQLVDSVRSIQLYRRGYPPPHYRFDDTDGSFVWTNEPEPRAAGGRHDLAERFEQCKGLAEWRVRLFQAMLDDARAIGAKIYLFLPPIQPDAIAELDRTAPKWKSVRASVLGVLEDERKKGGVTAVHDFTEVETFGGLPDDFSDALHILDDNAARMTHALFSE